MRAHKKLLYFLFGIFLAAATLFWQQYFVSYSTSASPMPNTTTLPLWQGSQATFWSTNQLNTAQTTLFSKTLHHFDSPKRTNIHTPRGAIQNQKGLYFFEAQKGTLTKEQLTLKHKAHIQLHTSSSLPLHLRGSLLIFTPAQDQLHSPQHVKITQGANWMTGKGFKMNMKLQTLELMSEVISHYDQ